MSWWTKKNKKYNNSPWGKIKSPKEINKLNQWIKKYEQQEFNQFEQFFDKELAKLFMKDYNIPNTATTKKQKNNNKSK